MQTVVILDKNPSLAEALATQLSVPNSIYGIGYSSDVELCVVLADQKPDLLIVDPSEKSLKRPDDLVRLCDAVYQESPSTRLLCYSFDASGPIVRAALDAGCHGCLSKYCSIKQLEFAVAAVLGGGIYFDAVFGDKLRDRSEKQDRGLLSGREKEVLMRIAKGLAPKQIAFDLRISAKTVETYKSRAVQKLGLADRSKVVEYALEHGWIT